jgi:amino acid transporter
VGFIIITSILNVIGIKAAANATMLLMIFQVLVLAIFVALSLRHVFHTGVPGRSSAARLSSIRGPPSRPYRRALP